jgi:drug/metabolite transporter (DMT)-like permease
MQVAALRSLSSLPLVCAYVAWRGGSARCFSVPGAAPAARRLGIAMLALFAYGLKKLSLAEAYSIFFIAPALITALSVWFLKERVNLARWIAIVVGMAGVLVVLRPEGEGMLTLGGLAILASAACYAISAIAARVLARSDSSEQMMFWLMLLMAIGATTLAAPNWVALGPTHVLAAAAAWPFPASSASWRSPRPSATAKRRWWRPSSIRRWPGAWRSTGCCGKPCPTSTR